MSVLLGPFDKPDKFASRKVDDNEFLVFGYQCRLYKDDEKAELENSGELLIPWMGDKYLMVDRYDVRNRFDDKSQFGLKSNLPYRMTDEEEELEMLLDKERFIAIGTDITEEELRREEEQKRMYEAVAPEGTYNAVGFSYDCQGSPAPQEDHYQLVDQPQPQEHPSTTCIDNPEEGGEYDRPFRLFLPPNIQTPFSQKLHAVIERTALFVSKQGQQMEIIIKTKQRFNPNFSFLHHEDRLFPYYKQLLHAINSGSYEPQAQAEAGSSENTEEKGSNDDDDRLDNGSQVFVKSTRSVEPFVSTSNDSDSEDEEEGFELHPILRANLNPVKPTARTKENGSDSNTQSQTTPPNTERDSAVSQNQKFKSRTFKSIAYTINAAPDITEDMLLNEYNAVSTNESNGVEQCIPDVSIPGYTLCPGYDPMSAYYQASQLYQTGPIPPPPDLQPVIDKTAEYVAKNGDQFEITVIHKHLSDPRFAFLHPWNQYNHYYKTKVSEFKDVVKAARENAPANMQKLNTSGAVSFKMAAKQQALPIVPKGINLGHYGYNDDKGEEKEQEEEEGPMNKKIKMSETEIMDKTVKQFLSTVKSSFT